MADAKRYLTREDIEKATDLREEDVPVPEWGGTIRIRELSGDERDEFESATIAIRRDTIRKRRGGGQNMPEVDFVEEALHNVRARLVAAAAIDGQGNKLFTPDDVVWLGKRSAAALDRAYSVAAALAGLTEDDVEALLKGLRTTPNGASTTDSH